MQAIIEVIAVLVTMVGTPVLAIGMFAIISDVIAEAEEEVRLLSIRNERVKRRTVVL